VIIFSRKNKKIQILNAKKPSFSVLFFFHSPSSLKRLYNQKKMFETNLQQDEILQQEQNEFATAARLPTFSLPPNLNSKLVSNKQQANNRPRLCNLRSTWSSQQSIEEETFAEDKLIDITLPTPTLNDNSAIEKEILILLRIATSLCLLSSISASIFTTYYKKLHSLFLGEWILLFAWHTLHKIGRTEEQNTKRIVDIITLFSSIFMLVITFVLSHNNNNNGTSIFLAQQFTTSFGIALIYITQRLTKLKPAIQKEKELQQEKAQQVIDRALNSYSDRRQKFLSTVSQEIRDASLMVMATLEHFAPSSILTNTHELLSACSIAVPIASISAINTTIKQVCHISSHFNLLSRMLREADTHHVIPEEDRVKSTVSHDFDVSELIQNVGDALAGMSAKLGVHFVIYHMDNGLYYSNVIGDEDAIKHALINVSLIFYHHDTVQCNLTKKKSILLTALIIRFSSMGNTVIKKYFGRLYTWCLHRIRINYCTHS
jgi:osomolarity two-component system response regulator SSK1